jgi:hypothetical protein
MARASQKAFASATSLFFKTPEQGATHKFGWLRNGYRNAAATYYIDRKDKELLAFADEKDAKKLWAESEESQVWNSHLNPFTSSSGRNSSSRLNQLNASL